MHPIKPKDLSCKSRHMRQVKPKGLSLGLVFQFLDIWVLGLSILQISCKFRIKRFNVQKKILIFGYGFEYILKKLEKKYKLILKFIHKN